jgi:hypothetical protein
VAPYIYSTFRSVIKIACPTDILEGQEMRNSKKNRGAKVYGRPGSSANSNNALKQMYNNLSWGKKVAIFVVGTVLGALSSLAAGINPLLGGALIAGLILFLASLFFNRGTWATILILATYAVISVPLGGVMLASSSQAQLVYAVEAGVSLFTAALLVGWLSLRYGKLAPWKIMGIAFVASSITGIAAAQFSGDVSLNVARLTMLIAVAYGCGVFDWVSTGIKVIINKIKKIDESDYNNPLTLSENDSKKVLSSSERKTANALSEMLDDNYTVFHDVTVKNSGTIPHVVIGPAGVFVLASAGVTSEIVETASAGLIVPGVDIGSIANSLVSQRALVATALKVRLEEVSLGLVVHSARGNEIKDLSKSFAAFDRADAKTPAATISMVSVDMLGYLVAPGMALVSPATVAILEHKAQSVFKPSLRRLSSEGTMVVAPISLDGKIMKPATMETAQNWIRIGAVAKVSLQNKTVDNVRIYTEPYVNDKDELVVGIVLQEEWDNYKNKGITPEVFTFPVSNISK